MVVTISIRTAEGHFLNVRIHPIPQTSPRVHIPCAIVVQSRLLVELLTVELVRHLLTAAVFVHEQFAIRQVSIELGDVGLGVGDVRM